MLLVEDKVQEESVLVQGKLTCTLGGNGTGNSKDQSPTAIAAAELDTPVSYVLKLCPVLCTNCF